VWRRKPGEPATTRRIYLSNNLYPVRGCHSDTRTRGRARHVIAEPAPVCKAVKLDHDLFRLSRDLPSGRRKTLPARLHCRSDHHDCAASLAEQTHGDRYDRQRRSGRRGAVELEPHRPRRAPSPRTANAGTVPELMTPRRCSPAPRPERDDHRPVPGALPGILRGSSGLGSERGRSARPPGSPPCGEPRSKRLGTRGRSQPNLRRWPVTPRCGGDRRRELRWFYRGAERFFPGEQGLVCAHVPEAGEDGDDGVLAAYLRRCSSPLPRPRRPRAGRCQIVRLG
jgi:hypothetical protein